MPRTYRYLLLILFGATVCYGQTPTISSDRPGQALSAFTVGERSFQHQMGFDFFDQKTNSFIQQEHNALKIDNSFRYGITKSLEIGIGLSLQKNENIIEDTIVRKDESGNASLKFRSNIIRNRGWIDALGYELSLGVPLYMDELDIDDLSLTYTLLSSHSFGRAWSLATNWGVVLSSTSSYDFTYVINLGYGLNDKWSVFAEHYAFIDPKDTGWDAKWDAGLAYLVNKNFQIDFFAGYDTNDPDHSEYFGSLGISWRLLNSKR